MTAPLWLALSYALLGPPIGEPSPSDPPAEDPEARELAFAGPELRVSLAAGVAHDLDRSGIGWAARMAASLHDFVPILDPQVVLVSASGLPDADSLLMAGVGGRLTLPRIGPIEVAADLAVLLDTSGGIGSQLGATVGARLLPHWQLNLYVTHVSESPIVPGVLSEGLELQYLF